jgi:predicted amidohydrolase
MPKISIAQMEPILFDKDANLVKMKSFLMAASRKEADLILFPELALTGYYTKDKTSQLAE